MKWYSKYCNLQYLEMRTLDVMIKYNSVRKEKYQESLKAAAFLGSEY